MNSDVRHRFRAGRGSTLGVILLFPLLTSLGFWQLDRAEQKQAIADAIAENRTQPMLDIVTSSMIAATQEGRRASAQGQFIGPILLLDNRTRAGQAGYEVLTPFKLNDGSHLLVARGWVPVGDDRARPPEIDVPATTRRIRGVLAPPPATGIALPASDQVEKLAPDVWRIQQPALSIFAGAPDSPNLALLLYLDPSEPNGYDRAWPPRARDISKHHAYAVQWFAMAAVLLVLYVRVNRNTRGSRENAA